MKISNIFLLALILIFMTAFFQMGFTQEKESTITIQQDQSEKDLKLQKEKKPEEEKSTPSREAQQRYDYNVAEILRESQRNVDRSINILSLVATFTCGFISLFAIAITIAGLTGFFSYRRWMKIKKTVEEDMGFIKDVRNKAENEINEWRKYIDKKGLPSLPEEATKEFKEKLDEFGRIVEFFELLGLSIKSGDYINRGWDLFYKGNFEFALRAFEKAIELEPENQNAWLGKGHALADLVCHEEALIAHEKAIKLKPDDARSWVNKGFSLGRLCRHEEALIAYDKGIELKPDYADAWFNKACIYGLKGDKENTLLHLSKAIEFNVKLKEKAKTDEDFKSLWEDPDFKKITS